MTVLSLYIDEIIVVRWYWRIKMSEDVKAHIFVSTDKTESECFQRRLFSTNKLHADDVMATKAGDLLFLFNVNSNVLHGIFRAKTDGRKNIVPEAWKGKYPYQVEVEQLGNIQTLKKSKSVTQKTRN